MQRRSRLVRVGHDALCCGPGRVSSASLDLVHLVSRVRVSCPFVNDQVVQSVLRHRKRRVNQHGIQHLVHLVEVRTLCPGPGADGPGLTRHVFPCLLGGVIVSRSGRI